MWDHPRACGEHELLYENYDVTLGSSPRLRGTLIAVYCSGLTVGIIPALAGNTVSHLWSPPFRWDHPRACGELCQSSVVSSFPVGSSPRLRGTRWVKWRQYSRVGIIPALAGNTGSMASLIMSPWDHPRACGEHMDATTSRTDEVGSSPRLRGTLRVVMIGS